MRGRFAGALLLGVAGIAAANAADLTGGRGGYGDYWSFGARMEPVIVYDFEPGVIVRSYWYPPLDNRHYFPRTGRRPKLGRLEHWPARRISEARIVLSLLVGIVGLRASAGLAWIRCPRIAIAIAAVIHPRRRRLAT